MTGNDRTQSNQVRDWIGYTAYDADGEKVGKVEDVYEDEHGRGPEWFALSTGWFGTKRSLAPVYGSTADGDRLVLPWTKAQIKNAPTFANDDDLDFDEADGPHGHYNMTWDAPDVSTRYGATDLGDRVDEDAMTRSEEELDVTTRSREAGRVRLRKWVETEHKEVTVAVRREVARLVTEPITDTNTDEAEIMEEEFDVVLHEEEVVVDKRVVPKERVRLETDTVESEQTVDETLRKERVAMESDDTRNQ